MAGTDNRTREERILQMMKVTGMSRESASFAVAIEMGELPGDAIPIQSRKETASHPST